MHAIEEETSSAGPDSVGFDSFRLALPELEIPRRLSLQHDLRSAPPRRRRNGAPPAVESGNAPTKRHLSLEPHEQMRLRLPVPNHLETHLLVKLYNPTPVNLAAERTHTQRTRRNEFCCALA